MKKWSSILFFLCLFGPLKAASVFPDQDLLDEKPLSQSPSPFITHVKILAPPLSSKSLPLCLGYAEWHMDPTLPLIDQITHDFQDPCFKIRLLEKLVAVVGPFSFVDSAEEAGSPLETSEDEGNGAVNSLAAILSEDQKDDSDATSEAMSTTCPLGTDSDQESLDSDSGSDKEPDAFMESRSDKETLAPSLFAPPLPSPCLAGGRAWAAVFSPDLWPEIPDYFDLSLHSFFYLQHTRQENLCLDSLQNASFLTESPQKLEIDFRNQAYFHLMVKFQTPSMMPQRDAGNGI